MGSFYLLSAALLLLGAVILHRGQTSRSSGGPASVKVAEPPTASSSIPFIGHLIGLSRQKFEYYVSLSKKLKSPVFTLYLARQKIYVITTPDLVQVAQKQHQILRMIPIQAKFSILLTQPSEEGAAILNQNLGDKGEWGVHVDNKRAMREGTAPGPEVDQMNREMIREVTIALDQLNPAKGDSTQVRLYAWLRDKLSTATTNAVYGPHNPYKDVEVMKSFWDFEQGAIQLIMMPPILARKPAKARDKIAVAFEHYYRNGYHKESSLLTRNRYDAMEQNNISLKDQGKFEVLAGTAILVNTVPAAFWLIFHIYSSPGLLEAIRDELAAVTHTNTDPVTGRTTCSLDVTSAKGNCPLLLSTYQESLRHHAMGMTVREVTEDTILGQYALTKGAMVHMPTRVLHTDPAVWGPSAREFRPRRFIKGEKHDTTDGKPPADLCFRAFGGGKTLCPGRHFATNEVIAVVAVFVNRFNMRPTNGQEWKAPTTFSTSMTSVIMVPDWDIDVEITRRPGFEDTIWQISLTDSDLVLPLTAEDHS